MNYRNGVQRLYAVLAVAWVLLTAVMVTSNRWIWQPWRITPISWEEDAKQYGLSFSDKMPTDGKYVGDIIVRPRTKLIWICALSLPMPITGYLLLFQVIPWVYRGFRRESSATAKDCATGHDLQRRKSMR
jgi:hypothetical protein